MTTAIGSHNPNFSLDNVQNPLEFALHTIVEKDCWIWENNPIVQDFPDFIDDDGFDAVDADVTRELLRRAQSHFVALFDSINGKQRVNETRAKVALTGLLITANLSNSPLISPALEASDAFYKLCRDPTSRIACSVYIYAHVKLTIALMQTRERSTVDDAWHSAFAYHGKQQRDLGEFL